MATFDPAVSSLITARPSLEYVSDNGSSQIVVKLGSIPANAMGCYIYNVPADYENGVLIPKGWKADLTNLVMTGLTTGPHIFIAVPYEADGKVGPASNRVRVFLGTTQGLDSLLEHLETQLKNLVWVTVPVFGHVQITREDPDELQVQFSQKPIALITLDASSPSPTGGNNYPGLIRASISIHIYHRNASMDRGRGGVMGANEIAADSSVGKGILELRRKIRSELDVITTADGTRYQYIDSATSPVQTSTKQGFITKLVMNYIAEAYDAE